MKIDVFCATAYHERGKDGESFRLENKKRRKILEDGSFDIIEGAFETVLEQGGVAMLPATRGQTIYHGTVVGKQFQVYTSSSMALGEKPLDMIRSARGALLGIDEQISSGVYNVTVIRGVRERKKRSN